jgi:hypothetical protein
MTLDIPERTGRHVLYVIWQRDDPAGEAFISTSDLDFGGVDYGNPGDGDVGDGTEQVPLGVGFAWTGQWTGGGQAEFTVTNTTDRPLLDWSLRFDWSAQVTSAWEGELRSNGTSYEVRALPYNMAIPPGGSVTVGVIATTPVPGVLPTSIAALGAVVRDPEPCSSDLDGDGSVDGADLGRMLAAWGATGAADLNGDGIVDGVDLGALLGAWGPCP